MGASRTCKFAECERSSAGFRDGRVSEMVVSYWDTAACLAAIQAAAANA
jgi:ketosteroid isomerase-like protein